MKKIYINKCGYTVGQYGCSNEFFNLVVIDNDKIVACTFSGLYGAESRVKEVLKAKGFEDFYIPLNTYGQLRVKETKNAHSEYVLINNIDEFLKNGYIEYNKEYRKKAGLLPIKK